MVQDKFRLFRLLKNLYEYVGLRIKLLKLEGTEKGSKIVSGIASAIILFLLAVFFITLFNIFLALLIAHFTGHYYIGFGVVTLFYLLIIIFLLVFNKQVIRRPIENKLIKLFFSE